MVFLTLCPQAAASGPGEDQAADVARQVKMTAFPVKTLPLKEFINRVFLTRPNLQNNMALGGQMAPRPVRKAAVGLQPVRPAIKGPWRVKFPHIRGQTGDIAERNIGRV